MLGSGAVYVFDGAEVTDTNIATEEEGRAMSIYDVRLHVLAQSDGFDLTDRRPKPLSRRQADEKLPKADPESEKSKAKGQGNEDH